MLVLDTNTISYFFRGDPLVVPRMQALPPSELAVPAIVVYELRYGLMRLPAEAARPRLEALNALLNTLQTLPFDEACAAHAAEVRSRLESLGTPIGPHDVLIAATAMRHHSPLVSRNVREFSRVSGLQVLNWHDT